MVGYIIGGIALLFILVVAVRTIAFRPKKAVRREVEEIRVDANRAAETLAEMIRCKTVSSTDKSAEDEGEFSKFEKLLPNLFPELFAVATFTKVSDRALLIKWCGEREGAPTVLMAHYDVVSVDEDKWERPAFDGLIEDGVLWGRGVIDTKGSLNGALYAANELVKTGFTPKNDIYFAFAGDEEINGHGAQDIVALFKERGIEPALVLDEGGAVITNVFPGVKQKCAVVGIAEKGMVNIEYSISDGGGHASAPKPHTPVGYLARACTRVENHPLKFRITDPTRQMFDTLGPHSSLVYRIIFANLWCFGPVLNLVAKKTGGQLNAVARTTVAFTQMKGSKGINVIPPYASMASNSRILPGESVESTLAHVKKVVNDDKIEIKVINGNQPSRVSTTKCEGWQRLTGAISDTWQDALVSPYLMTACSDSRHWGIVSDKVYRFSPKLLSKEENAMVHGNNERLPIKSIAETVEFYIRLIKMS